MSVITMRALTPSKQTQYHFNRKDSKLLKCPLFISCAARRRRLPNCSAVQLTTAAEPTVRRRSGNYKPPLWDFHYIQSLDHQYTEERYWSRASELMEQVRMLLNRQEIEPVRQLELIDDLQKLGISYHFEDQIKHIIEHVYIEHKYCNNINVSEENDLYSTALGFRLFRQHGFQVSQEVFECFKNEEGEFKQSLGENAKGLLQLYEASFLLREGENSLELAREFSLNFLGKKVDDEGNNGIDDHLSSMVRHALELPLHWRLGRPYARWFIDWYERRADMRADVLQLAKLDFNIVQATHRQELQHVSRWWKQTRLAEKLPFARDRVVESYLLTIGLLEPQYGYSRIIGTKVNALVTIIDDMFDVYGTMDELLLFNDVIQRWDIEAIDQLPNYMQMCFLELNNFVNEMAYDVLNEQGVQIIPYLRKSWADLCTSYIQEAKWYSEGYKPRLKEYLNNAWISISVPVMLTHAFFALGNPIHKEAVESLYKYHDILKYSGTIARLTNDLATSPDEMKRGDVPKSVQCYMNERGVESNEARQHIKTLISDTWKKMNGLDCALPQDFVRCAAELGRIAHYVYQEGDAYGIQNSQVKDQISSLLFHPISSVA
ncbi:hypothetical protein ACS0TY_002928 [Phlomoides rotata]